MGCIASAFILADGEQATGTSLCPAGCQTHSRQHAAPVGTDCHALTNGQRLIAWGHSDAAY